MDSTVLNLVAQVISKSDRAHPADAVLRQEMRTQHGATRAQATEISRLVFSYYRWLGWLDERQELSARLLQAADLAENFAHRPQDFSDRELTQRSVPAWIGEEIEIIPEFARALQTEPRLWLRARPGEGASLAKALRHCQVLGNGILSDTLAYHGREDLFQSPQFHAGAFELQDVSSQAVGWLCSPHPGQTWWDCCAGEGGKLLHLSDLMRNQGLIWASDRAQWRLRKLKRRAARARVFNYRAELWDGGARLPTKTRFDGVLLDAPCSGTGTWQRNPHARWTLVREDIKELADLQLRLLRHAASAVKPGGQIFYSVCSLARSETIGVVEGFEKAVPGFVPIRLTNPLVPGNGETEVLFLWPQQVNGNGMFVAGWTRE
ncbi:MAG TPA: RsmB/NOP family class I SAM-dependent RNA methyltransferase [Verrucomicrobiae bacterium]|nr:RsmB/NOP family class I SAM-dependent RNA methyltransferase [Verrucomicrobiae bacterium]